MKLLIVTQVVDTDDPVLGFFHKWIERLSAQYESVEVICLRKGKYTLPANVRVHSLGKELGRKSKITYVATFLSLAWKLRGTYDAVFVHMNQEYVLLSGWLWALCKKPVYLWRNHYKGSLLTDMASVWCKKVFCTSKHSYTARYKKTVLMPVGVDTDLFYEDENVKKVPRSILFLWLMSPSKRPEPRIDALGELEKKGAQFAATFVGSPKQGDEMYYKSLKEKTEASSTIHFVEGMSHTEVPDVFRKHEIFVNTSPSGMLDKTIFEAAACGAVPLAVSADWRERVGDDFWYETTPANLAQALERVFASLAKGTFSKKELQAAVQENSLSQLCNRLNREMSLT